MVPMRGLKRWRRKDGLADQERGEIAAMDLTLQSTLTSSDKPLMKKKNKKTLYRAPQK